MPQFMVRVPVKVTAEDGTVCPAQYVGASVEAEDSDAAAKMVSAALEGLLKSAKVKGK